MQSVSGRYINSVSDIIGTDEIEFLLDDIRDLEPTSVNPEDIQVFRVSVLQVCLVFVCRILCLFFCDLVANSS